MKNKKCFLFLIVHFLIWNIVCTFKELNRYRTLSPERVESEDEIRQQAARECDHRRKLVESSHSISLESHERVNGNGKVPNRNINTDIEEHFADLEKGGVLFHENVRKGRTFSRSLPDDDSTPAFTVKKMETKKISVWGLCKCKCTMQSWTARIILCITFLAYMFSINKTNSSTKLYFEFWLFNCI